MNYSPGEAAKLVRVNKSTVLRAIQAGKLSATRHEDGTFSIDGSELARVYDMSVKKLPRADAMPRPAPTHAAAAPPAPLGSEAIEVAVLRARLEAAEASLAREREALGYERETVADLRKRLDQEQEERRNLQRQLAPPAAEKPVEAPPVAPAGAEPPKASKGFLARLLGV